MITATIKINEETFHRYGFSYNNNIPVYSLQMCEGTLYKISRMDRGCSSQMIIESFYSNDSKSDKKLNGAIYTSIYRGLDVGKADFLIKPTLLLTTIEQWGGKFVVLDIRTGKEDVHDYCSEINKHVCDKENNIWMRDRPHVILNNNNNNNNEIIINYSRINKVYVFSMKTIPFEHVITLNIDKCAEPENVFCSCNELYFVDSKSKNSCILVYCKDTGEYIRTIDINHKQENNVVMGINANYVYLVTKYNHNEYSFCIIDTKTGDEISQQPLKHRAFRFYKSSYTLEANNRFRIGNSDIDNDKIYVIDRMYECDPEGELREFDCVYRFSIIGNA